MIAAATAVLAGLGAFTAESRAADDNSAITYQGRVRVGGKPLNGVAQFRFAVLGDMGEVLFSTREMSLTASNGFYEAQVGGGPSGKKGVLHTASLARQAAPRLRIWFNDETGAWVQLGEDVMLREPVRPPAQAADAQPAILDELRQLRAIVSSHETALATPREPQTATVTAGNGPSLGASNTPVVLVEFTDFECAYCARFETEVFPLLLRDYVGRNLVRIVSRHRPLSIHPQAEPAARAAICAEWQGLFWPMRQKLFAAQGGLSAERITRAAAEAGLDLPLLSACQTNAEVAAVLQRDVQEAKSAGIRATPTFIVGKMAEGKVTGMRIVGAQPYEVFRSAIESVLSEGSK